MTPEPLEEAIDRGIKEGNWNKLKELITDECSMTMNYGADVADPPFGERAFHILAETLKMPAYWSAQGSSNLIRIIEYDWSVLSPEQKSTVIPLLRNAFPHMVDDLALFLIVELLGEFVGGPEGLDALHIASTTSEGHRRAFIPNGLAEAYNGSSDAAVREAALAELNILAADDWHETKREAEAAIEKIKRLSDDADPISN
jgi:hypothetical protein